MAEARGFSDRAAGWAVRSLCGFVLIFLILPILVIIPLSVTSDNFLLYPLPGLSWRWYEDLISNQRWAHAAWNSLSIGFTVMLISTALGTAAALGLDSLTPRLRRIGGALFLLPTVVPHVVLASSLYFVFSAMKLTNSFPGIVAAHCLIAAPFVVITVGATLRGFDGDLMRAAVSLGAPPVSAFFRIMLPLILPGIISGALFAFAISFDEVILALMIAGPSQRTLPLQMMDGISEHLSPTITAAATTLVFLSLGLLITAEFLRRRSYTIAAKRQLTDQN